MNDPDIKAELATASGGGYFQKYDVKRRNGKPIGGPTFTIELDRDPVGVAAIRLYAAMTENAELATALKRMLGEKHPLNAQANEATTRLP